MSTAASAKLGFLASDVGLSGSGAATTSGISPARAFWAAGASHGGAVTTSAGVADALTLSLDDAKAAGAVQASASLIELSPSSADAAPLIAGDTIVNVNQILVTGAAEANTAIVFTA